MLLVQPLSQPMRSGYQLFINLTYAVVLAAACPRAQRHLLARLGVAESLGRDTRPGIGGRLPTYRLITRNKAMIAA